MYAESVGPYDYKVPFVKFRLANWENTGDFHRVLNLVFSVFSYTLVLRYVFHLDCAKLQPEYVTTTEFFKLRYIEVSPL